MICRICGGEVEPGNWLPWRHTHPQGRGHYVKAIPAPTSAAGFALSPRFRRLSRALPAGPSRRT